MRMVNISEARAQLSSLIAAAGKEILIGKAGEASAKLVPYCRSEEPHRPGTLSGDWHRQRFVARRYSWRSRDDG